VSLTNAHSLEYGVLYEAAANLEAALTAIVSEILAERPHWECLRLSELEPRDPG